MLSISLKVNGKQIDYMTIQNTGDKQPTGTIYKAVRLGNAEDPLTAVPLFLLHDPKDGAWTLLRKAIERFDEVERDETTEARSLGSGTLARELRRMPRGTDAGLGESPNGG